MAQFYGDIQGNRGEATRMGTKESGISAHVRGWNVGARVIVAHEDGRDVVQVWATSGSHGREASKLIAKFDSIENA